MDHRPTLGLVLLLLGLSLARGNDAQIDKTDNSSITSMILNSNNGTNELLLEGDILLPKTRNAMKCYKNNGRCVWMKSADHLVYVPYVISNEYSSDQVETINKAMKSFSGKTCIRFIPRTQQTAYLQIESRGGCFSSMGRVGEKQILSLAAFSCIQHGIIQHELLHALGFYHEHTRSDRDQYVRINWNYVADYATDNFQMQDNNNLNIPYDYSSVMHYDKKAFSNDLSKETITPIPDESVKIGQRREMSDIDILRVNKLYKC
ncbi:low choriolytic enzyme-like [Esox lucius]|uniref:low choriolytic enzyme-like n=1 Tax=Esox lucius TaxID=8010 RepID=UPI001476D1D1|nr:low choriolytic enzyme-like [Esox lucius]